MTGWDVLERHFDGLTPEEVDAALTAVPARGATPSSAAAAAYVHEHGGPDLDERDLSTVQRRRAVTASRTLVDTMRSAVTIDEAADLLDVSRSRVSHRLAAHSLWAFTVGGRRHLPRWQFTSGRGTLPGLATIVPAIPAHLHPLAVASFMETPLPDLDGRSPVEWLTSGGDPQPVADWLTGMAHG